MILTERRAWRARPTRDEAQAIAIEALGFLGADPDRISRFLSLAGIEPAALRQAAASPGFLPGILDFLLADESMLLDFAASAQMSPSRVASARSVLSDVFGSVEE